MNWYLYICLSWSSSTFVLLIIGRFRTTTNMGVKPLSTMTTAQILDHPQLIRTILHNPEHNFHPHLLIWTIQVTMYHPPPITIEHPLNHHHSYLTYTALPLNQGHIISTRWPTHHKILWCHRHQWMIVVSVQPWIRGCITDHLRTTLTLLLITISWRLHHLHPQVL